MQRLAEDYCILPGEDVSEVGQKLHAAIITGGEEADNNLAALLYARFELEDCLEHDTVTEVLGASNAVDGEHSGSLQKKCSLQVLECPESQEGHSQILTYSSVCGLHTDPETPDSQEELDQTLNYFNNLVVAGNNAGMSICVSIWTVVDNDRTTETDLVTLHTGKSCKGC